MIKKAILLLISFYQTFVAMFIKTITGSGSTCRFEVSCSDYAKLKIKEDGVLKGSFEALRRVLYCQPFYNGKYI